MTDRFLVPLVALLYGMMLGMSLTMTYNQYRYTTFNVPLYKVGDCLSNNLYFEKIVEIRKSKLFSVGPLYVTYGYFGKGKRDSRPETVDTWIADKSYTKVESKYCGE